MAKKSMDLINKYNLAPDAKKATEKLIKTLDQVPSGLNWKSGLVVWWIRTKIIRNFQKPIEKRVTQDEFERWHQILELAIKTDLRKNALKLFKSTGKLLGRFQWLLLISEEAIEDKKQAGKYDPNSRFALQYNENRKKLNSVIEQHKKYLNNFDHKLFSDEANTMMSHYKHWFLRHVKPGVITSEWICQKLCVNSNSQAA